jgi:phage-related protein
MPDNYPCRITFYEDHRGKKLVLDFINSLPKWEQAKVYNSLRLLAEFGALLRMPHARHIQGKLWELRPGGVRLFYFTFKNNEFVILHGFRKQSKQAPRLEIEVALRRLRELEET